LNIAGHPLHNVWIFYQRLDTWVPRLLCHSVGQRFALQILVVIHPLLKLNYFQWIGRSGESLRQEWIGVERDRRDQRIQFTTRKCRRLLRVSVCRGGHDLRLRLLCKRCRGRGCEQCDTCAYDHAMK
jgi:hypothetical protein